MLSRSVSFRRRFSAMKPDGHFPEKACAYSRALAAVSPRFARQVYDPPAAAARPAEEEYGPDPFGELTRAAKVKGLKQRFPDRVLLMTSARCFMNCRHCTRRGLFGKTPIVETDADLARCVAYVKAHPKVRDVLLSGGDPLTLSDARLLRFVDAFVALPQVEVVRVCTRAPCTNPARVTKRLARALGRSGKVWVNTQFNCADEVTAAARAAAARLVEAGIPVGCQTVLLKGVNDSAAELLRLFRALTAARIRPYYVFMCDPIAGIGHFRVPLEKARRLERICAESVGGLALPRFVMDVPGARRKQPI
jgi:lysine 2,3-aminomutase